MSLMGEQRAAKLAELPLIPAGAGSRGPLVGFISTVRELFRQRQLLDLLIRRELKSRYKDSRLGFIWSFVRPLTQLLVYYVVIGQVLGGAGRAPQFAIFVFSGITIWGLYNEIVVTGTASIISNAGLIKKVYLPREIFPLSVVGSAMFNFVVQFAVLCAAIILLGQIPWHWEIFYAFGAIVDAIIFSLAVALVLSAVNVFLRDIHYIVEVAMLLLFWASPIIYPWSNVVGYTLKAGVPWVAQLYLLNPISDIVIAFQRGMWLAGSHVATLSGKVIAPQPWPSHMAFRLVILGLVGILFLWVAQRIFARLQGNFAQEL
jgi:ABC-2 type transport system permease protein